MHYCTIAGGLTDASDDDDDSDDGFDHDVHSHDHHSARAATPGTPGNGGGGSGHGGAGGTGHNSPGRGVVAGLGMLPLTAESLQASTKLAQTKQKNKGNSELLREGRTSRGSTTSIFR